MDRSVTLAALLAATVVLVPARAMSAHAAHKRHGSHAARSAGYGYGYGYGRRPYASSVSPTITCRYPDGTPYDPDIIGGPNHVGDGGPAANLGGFNPCAF